MAACSFQARPNPGSGDDGVDGGAVMACAWATHFDACELPGMPPAQALVLNGGTKWTFTTLGTGGFGPVTPAGGFVIRKLSQTGGGRDVLALYTSAFTLGAGATLDVTGDKAFVIVADSTIEIAGVLDAGSHTGNSGPPVIGPGANDIGCAGSLNGGVSSGGSSGGGGGGALAANGGLGGDGNNGGPGGVAGARVALPAFIRAGCAGGTGGGSTTNDGNGGNGGGTVELAARGAITVTGHINAGGGGGEGGAKQQGGGGGGGSGGIISFHAPTVTFAPTAVIVANGGGGGSSGGDEDSGHSGNDGPLAATSARGGGDPGSDRAGGDGGALTKTDGSPGAGGNNGSGGGGGGGGSVGYVMVRAGSFSPAGVVSPSVSRL
jgi:hypothetical protein